MLAQCIYKKYCKTTPTRYVAKM